MSIQIKIDIDKDTAAELAETDRKKLSQVLDSIALSFVRKADELRKTSQDVDLTGEFSVGLTYNLRVEVRYYLATTPEQSEEPRHPDICGRCKHPREYHREDGCSVVSAGCDCMKFLS